MNIKEAFDKLNAGEPIRRKDWPLMLHLRLCYNDEKKKNTVQSFEEVTIAFIYDLDILTSSDWRLFNDDKLITFLEALDLLKEGKKVQSKDWTNDTYIEADQKKSLIMMKTIRKKDWMPLLECLLANDWEVLV